MPVYLNKTLNPIQIQRGTYSKIVMPGEEITTTYILDLLYQGLVRTADNPFLNPIVNVEEQTLPAGTYIFNIDLVATWIIEIFSDAYVEAYINDITNVPPIPVDSKYMTTINQKGQIDKIIVNFTNPATVRVIQKRGNNIQNG